MRLDIRRFDPACIAPGRIVLLIGKRGTGKSFLAKDLLYHMRKDVHIPVVMSPTHSSIADFEKFVPRSLIHDRFNPDTIQSLIDSQRARAHTGKKLRNVCLVLDDCMYDKKCLRSVAMRDIFMNGRHSRLGLIIAVQYLMDLDPAARSQIDYVFTLRENIISNRKKLWQFFFGMWANYDDFAAVMDACTNNHEALVLDNVSSGTNDVTKCVFWYKASATIPTDFRLGSRTMWKLHYRLKKNKKSREEEEEVEAQSARTRARAAQKHDRVDAVIKLGHDAPR